MTVKCVLAAFMAVGLATAASADGYQARRAYYAHPFSWSGCYLGGFVGGAWGGNVSATEAVSQGGVFPAGTFYNTPFGAPYGYDLGSSFIGGGTIGCNHQFGALVVGAEGEIGGLHVRGSTIDPNSVALYGRDTSDSTRIGNLYGVVAGRFGVAIDRTLIYAKVGVQFLDLDANVLDRCNTAPCGTGLLNATGSGRTAGPAVGGGIEYALTNNWTIKGEYLYLNNTDAFVFPVCGAGAGSAAGSTFCSKHDVDSIHTFKLGINFKFGRDESVPLK